MRPSSLTNQHTVALVAGAALVLLVSGCSGRTPSAGSGGASSPSALGRTAAPAVSAMPPTASASAPPSIGTAVASPREAATSSGPGPTAGAAATSPVACIPTDQDRYVYHPERLEVLAPCVHVSGTVAAVRTEADGDLHLLLDLDRADRGLLRPANEGEELGDLVVEPVCVRTVSQADAIEICAADPDPLGGPFPAVGERVWMEGRSVLDLEHGGWAELHPLYRWGRLGGPAPTPAPAATVTPAPATTTTAYYTPPGWDGHSDVDCADFDTQAHAESFFLGTGGSTTNDPYRLDADHDGIACESLP